jgi:hypothetical protein
MERRLRPELFLLYVLAAISCKDDDPGSVATHGGNGGDTAGKGGSGGHVSAGRGGSGGESAGGGGSAGPPAEGSECDPGTDDTDAGSSQCTGGVINGWPRTCRRRYVDVQCYVTEDSECLPASTDGLVGRLGDFIRSAGFEPEFVLDSADELELPESCAALLQCCSRLTMYDRHTMCEDAIDGVSATYADSVCRDYSAHAEDWFGCKVTPNDNDAGAHAPVKQCCYRACGHYVDT